MNSFTDILTLLVVLLVSLVLLLALLLSIRWRAQRRRIPAAAPHMRPAPAPAPAPATAPPVAHMVTPHTDAVHNPAQLPQTALEFAVLLLFALLFFHPYPALSPQMTFGGIEYERLAGILIPVEVGLGERGYIPAWNPQMYESGTPLLNNAFNYLFNPFVSLPVLVFGAVQGSKLALFIALFIAGVNMWALLRAIGAGAVARVMAGGIYMVSGGIMGKLNPGHFQLALSLVWVPLVLAGCWWTLNSRDRRAPVLMAVAFMLLFFAGNIYYTLHTLLSCGIIYAFHAVRRDNGRWRLVGWRLQRVLLGAVLALLLCGLQFVPIWAVRESISHQSVQTTTENGVLELDDRYNLVVSMAHFVVPQPQWENLIGRPNDLRVGVDYAYIGWYAFFTLVPLGVFLIFVPQTRQRFRWRAGGTALLLALLLMLWGGGMTGVVNWLYLNVELLSEFRFLGRANAIAALWWVVLAALAVEALWRALGDIFPVDAAVRQMERRRLWRAAALGALLWLVALVYVNLPGLERFDDADVTASSLAFFEQLDSFRAWRLDEATNTIWFFVFGAALADTALMLLRRKASGGQFVLRRLGRAGLLLLAMLAVGDPLDRNNVVLDAASLRISDYTPLYDYIRAQDPLWVDLIVVNEPDTQNRMFRTYYAGVRNWGLDEGWEPAALPGEILPGSLLRLPRWTIVTIGNHEYVSSEINTYAPRVQLCTERGLDMTLIDTPDRPFSSILPDAPCDFVVPQRADTGGLFELAYALPYAYVVDADWLYNRPRDLRAEHVYPVLAVAHRGDQVIIRAAPPAEPHAADADVPTLQTPPGRAEYYLVIQETHFPGWRAFVDGAPVRSVTFDGYTGLPLLPGEHSYTIRYEPPGFAAGLALTVLGLLLCGVVWRGGLGARKSKAGGPTR